jgi:hypothetical protein
MKGVAVALALALSCGAAAASPSLTPQTSLEQGRLAYERGDYAEAVALLHPLLYPRIELGTEDAVVETHRLLALAELFQKQERDAEQEFVALLALRPNFELDPIVDPPSAVSFFQDVKLRQEARLAEIRRRQLEEETRRRREEQRRLEEQHAKAERVYIERTVQQNSRLIALIPFGIGQFQNRHFKKAILFAVSEVLLGAWWAGMTLAIDQRYPSHRFPVDDKDTANTLLALQVSAAAAFWAVVGWGIIDAQVTFVPYRVLSSKELTAPAPEPAKKASLSLVPVAVPGFYGLGVQGAF